MTFPVFSTNETRKRIEIFDEAPMTGKSLLILIALIISGFVGNYFPVSLFFGADFLFGSIPVLIVLYFFGLRWGMLAAVAAHSYTYFLWGHPYGFVNFVGEALFVGLFLRKGNRNLLGLVGLFWLTIGMPLVWIEHGVIMQMGATTTAFIMLKQATNGIFNALLATLAITYLLPLGGFSRRTHLAQKNTLRESFYNLLVMMVIFPALLLTGMQIKEEKKQLEIELTTQLQSLSANVQFHILAWYQTHLQAVSELAAVAGQSSMTPSPNLQQAAKLLNRSLPNFLTMHVESAEGVTIAFHPPVNEQGRSNLGLDFSGRSWFQEVKATRQPTVSDVFMGRLAVLSPIVNLSVPVFREKLWLGCATGTLDLGSIREVLRPYLSDKIIRLTLTDPQGRIIVSTDPRQAPMQPWNLKKTGVSEPLNDKANMYVWHPHDKKLPSMTRWKQSLYVQETLIGRDLPWKLTAEASVAPLQSTLYIHYVKNLSIIVMLSALALLLSLIFSRRLTQPLTRLAEVTANLPEKLESVQDIEWPVVSTHELDLLIGNFKSMAKTIQLNFEKIKLQSDELKQANRDLAKDATERQRAAEERHALEERLYRSEKMEALGTLAGGVAHDMNNVLGVLSGYSELLQEEIPEGSPLKHYVNNILLASEKGAAIIQDLLTLARRGVSVSEVLNINSITANFLKSPLSDRIQIHHPLVQFTTRLSPDLLNIKGSSVHLEKTVMNLVSNAAESITGRGTVTIRTENRYLDKPVHGYEQIREGDYAALTVSDTGGGIPTADLDKIFEPFYTKKKMGRSGTGLGLAIVWGTVKDHEGYIDVESIAGRGSTFTLYFPVTREDISAEQKKVPVEQYMGRGESLLVVDDVSEQRGVATGILSRLGYKVHAVSSGEEAAAYLKDNNADLIILDMIMEPGIDGLETYERIISFKPKQKAIIVSGFSETVRVTKAQELGAGAYLKKPYLKERIGIAVRQELDRT
jgi:signal transduction histidine kinase/ActR/RegA family two-component response regulator